MVPCFALCVFGISHLLNRVRAIEAREWPTKVVDWRPVYQYNPNCRCTAIDLSDDSDKVRA